MEIVEFKSIPEMFWKERDGVKPNTLRKIDMSDDRFKDLKHEVARSIKIRNTETNEYFLRRITDYTEWDGYAIISWAHQEYCSCGNPQSHPIPHVHDMTERELRIYNAMRRLEP